MGTLQALQTIQVAPPRIELNNQGKVLTFNLTGSYHQLGRDPQPPAPIGLVIPQDWGVVSRCQ